MRGRANVIEFVEAMVKETRPGVHEVLILTKFYVGGPVLNLMNARLHLGKVETLNGKFRHVVRLWLRRGCTLEFFEVENKMS